MDLIDYPKKAQPQITDFLAGIDNPADPANWEVKNFSIGDILALVPPADIAQAIKDLGLGSDSTWDIPALTLLSDLVGTRFFRHTGGSAPTDAPIAGGQGFGFQIAVGQQYRIQMWYSSTSSRAFYRRTGDTTFTQPWVEFHHSGNLSIPTFVGFESNGRHTRYIGDLNNIAANSVYNFSNADCQNFPTGLSAWGFLWTSVHVNSTDWRTQICWVMNNTDPRLWMRRRDSSGWFAWVEIGGGLIPVTITSNTTAANRIEYRCNTTAATFTLTLPSAPVVDTRIAILDLAGTFAINALTIANNGKRLMGLFENMTVSTANARFSLVFTGDDFGWRIE